MDILIFSDTHLYHRFNKKKYRFLKRIIESSDRVIINGDFWDGYLTDFDRFINSPWKQLFPLLKSKKTVYLYGNHDAKEFSDKRTSLFSDIQTYQYKLKVNNQTYVIEHGDRLFPIIGIGLKTRSIQKYTTHLSDALAYVMFGLLKTHFFRFLHQKTNETIKRKAKNEFRKNEILICGHTHLIEWNQEERYYNSGFMKYGVAQYILIKNGKVIPVDTRYD